MADPRIAEALPPVDEPAHPGSAVPPTRRLTLGQWSSLAGIVAIHSGAALALLRGPTWGLVATAAAAYALQIFGITVAYHRYFAHRSFRTGRVFQFLLALAGTTTAQKGPLWWAAIHRAHHRDADTDRDAHSPVRRGFWHAHYGWWWGREHEATRLDLVRDLARFPELRLLDRFHATGSLCLIAGLLLWGGVDAVLWGYCLATCLSQQVIFCINSLTHLRGSRRFATEDASRNHVLLGIVGFGEGWHNNHHHYMSSGRLGFYWWEIDLGYYAIKVCEALGLVWGVRRVPASVLRRNLVAEVGERRADAEGAHATSTGAAAES